MQNTLQGLGWSSFFERQITGDEPGSLPHRITAIHRDRVSALNEQGEATLITPQGMTTADLAVGDWVLADADNLIRRILDRQTVLRRRAAGTDAQSQLIAANVDTLLITSSCNADFNVARLERYIALANEAGCLPVIVLTKRDLADDPASYLRQAESLAPMQIAIAIDARDPADLTQISGWIGTGRTAALVGSSGVGKTTILNGLTHASHETQAIRDGDAHGRHTTTARELFALADGGWIIDTPGMRALRLHDADQGIEQLFSDIADLAQTCRFSDCSHETEPGCAVQDAIEKGKLDPERLLRWQKLKAEDIRNSQTLAQTRSRDRDFGKMIRTTLRDKSRRKGK
jgi:ribosome biogenesis GTPase